jgi:hypothetical protein
MHYALCGVLFSCPHGVRRRKCKKLEFDECIEASAVFVGVGPLQNRPPKHTRIGIGTEVRLKTAPRAQKTALKAQSGSPNGAQEL